MVKSYHHKKLELIGCLGYEETAGPFYSLKGPWGPHPLTNLACRCLRMFKLSSPIITPHHSPVAALVPEK